MIGSVLLFFVETKIGRTLALTLAIIIGVCIGWLAFATHYENKGYAKAVHAIAAQDSKAISEAEHARQTVKDCRDSGREWNVSDGVCE